MAIGTPIKIITDTSGDTHTLSASALDDSIANVSSETFATTSDSVFPTSKAVADYVTSQIGANTYFDKTILTSDWAQDSTYTNFFSTSFAATGIAESNFQISLQATAILSATDLGALCDGVALISTGTSSNGVVKLYAVAVPDVDLPVRLFW